MSHPLSHKYPIPISQLWLVNTDVPAGVGAPPVDNFQYLLPHLHLLILKVSWWVNVTLLMMSCQMVTVFRALSHQLYGRDQHHVHVQCMLLEVIESNKIIYQPYWIEDMPWGKTTFNEHLQRVAVVESWGTQVELQAVSDCFNVSVCSPNPSGIVRWEKKVPTNHSIQHHPCFESDSSYLPFTISYSTLLQ